MLLIFEIQRGVPGYGCSVQKDTRAGKSKLTYYLQYLEWDIIGTQ